MVRKRVSDLFEIILQQLLSGKRCLVILLISMLAIVPLNRMHAQDLQIVEVDSSQYPNIRIAVLFKGNTKFDEEKLSIRQDNKKLIYNIRESATDNGENPGRAVFFLVEASGNTVGKAVVDFNEGISAALDNLEAEDFLNVGWFGSYDADSAGLQFLSGKFTKEHSLIKKQLYKIYAKEDSLKRADLYKNILDALNYISRQDELPERKLFIVLGSSINNSSSPITSAECIQKAKEQNIPIFSVTYIENDSAAVPSSMTRISARTGGKNVQIKNQLNIINAINDFFSTPLPVMNKETKYDISFTVSPDINPSKAKIDLSYNGNRQILVVNDPEAGQLIPEDFKPYLWYSIGILGVLVVLMILYNAFSNKRSGSSVEAAPETASETFKKQEDAKQTQSGSSALGNLSEGKTKNADKTPVLLLSHDGRTQTFSLSKEKITLGRHETNDITLPEITVTGKHAVITINMDGISIEDLGSTNGTFVNGERIRKRRLSPGDIVNLGKVQLTLKE